MATSPSTSTAVISKKKPALKTLIQRMLKAQPAGLGTHDILDTLRKQRPATRRRDVRLAIKRAIREGLVARGAENRHVFKLAPLRVSLRLKQRRLSLTKKRKTVSLVTASGPLIAASAMRRVKKQPQAGKMRIAPKAPTRVAQPVTTKQQKKRSPAKGRVSNSSKGSAAEKYVSPAVTKAFVWQYTDDAGKFRNYDAKASDIVESSYEAHIANPHVTDVRSVHSGDWDYQVDFINMRQTNIRHQNHRVRTIRRVPNVALTA